MIALYTETLETLLKNKHYGEVSEDTSLTEVKNLMNKFPAFIFDENINLDMLTMFIQRYDIREIGAETEEMFLHFWREKTNELLMKYAPKMQKWLENFDDLFKFTVKLEKKQSIEENVEESKQETRDLEMGTSNTETRDLEMGTSNTETRDLEIGKSNTETRNTTDTTSEDTRETSYLNPITNSNLANLKVQDVDDTEKTTTVGKTGTIGNSGTETEEGTIGNSGIETEEGTISNSGTETEEGTITHSKDGNKTIDLEEERDVLQSVWGKTRADIMEKILNLKDIFNDCLAEFEVIFMGVY